MNFYWVEVTPKYPSQDSLSSRAEELGITGLTKICYSELYFFAGSITEKIISKLACFVLSDPVSHNNLFGVRGSGPFVGTVPSAADSGVETNIVVDIAPISAVTDTRAEAVKVGARILGITTDFEVLTVRRVVLRGDLTTEDGERIARHFLFNPVVETAWVNNGSRLDSGKIWERLECPAITATAPCEVIPLISLDDNKLQEISDHRRLALTLEEMKAIQSEFVRLGREPNDLELEMIAQTWSEHCSHKTFKALINYREVLRDPPFERHLVIDSLLDSTICEVTRRLDKDWVTSAFVDNAGIVDWFQNYEIAFKVETHNHPSALEPFGGANTGIGGVIRDILGVSARPVALTDTLCFGPEYIEYSALPEGVLHPARIMSGVIEGIGDYGNKMGIPTLNGAVLHHKSYLSNPLVFCGCLGIMPTGSHPTRPQIGDHVVVLGGRTGRDGLKGATFSSMEMTHKSAIISGSAVQIGAPIIEKEVLEVLMRARDEELYNGITDCGAGGLSSAVGELASDLGANVELSRVKLKYKGLAPWEIWLSEAQERMVLAVPFERLNRLKKLCCLFEVEVISIGVFTGDGLITIRMDGKPVGSLDTSFLFKNMPRRVLSAEWIQPSRYTGSEIVCSDLTVELMSLLSMPEIRSKKNIIHTYDHEVQGDTVSGPLTGIQHGGPSNGAVVCPYELTEGSTDSTNHSGVAFSVGINPFYGAIDPYHMAWSVIDEAIRNCVALGGDPDRVALLDNFCWGDPNLPDRLGGLVRCALGCYDGALFFEAPFISGKDSLNNETVDEDGIRRPIMGTLLISALSYVPRIERVMTSALKTPGDLVYLVGITKNELGGSALARYHKVSLTQVPEANMLALAGFRALYRANQNGLITACHDCSEGGLGVSLGEMCIGGQLGVDIFLESLSITEACDKDYKILFSESNSRFVVTCKEENKDFLQDIMEGIPCSLIGVVRADKRVLVRGLDGNLVVETCTDSLGRAWTGAKSYDGS